MARGRRCECTACFYCEREVLDRHEHDHFPVPKVAGGTAVVTACLDCHDLKDRYTLGNRWPVSGYFYALQGLLREVFAAVEQQASGGDLADLILHRSLTDEAVLARWSELPPLSRVLYGKLRCLHEEQVFRRRKDGQEVPALPTLATAVERAFAARDTAWSR